MNIDYQRKQQCYEFDCEYYELRCLIFHGKDCARYGGTKIPVMRSVDKQYPTPKPTKVKTQFVTWSAEEILRNEG